MGFKSILPPPATAAEVYGVNYLGRFASIKLAGWGG